MKNLKILQLFGLLIFFISNGISQTIVSTDVENKNVVLEEFTGLHCSYCPQGHAIAEGILEDHSDDVFIINIHAGGFSIPDDDEPDFRTDFGNAFAAKAGVTGYPSGTVNRHVFSGNHTALGRGQWSAAANQILGQTSYVNVGIETEINRATRIATIHVEIYYTENSPESINRLNIAVLQDSTIAPQVNGGNNYNHMHRLIDMPLGQWGMELKTTTKETFIDKTFTFTIPANTRDVPIILNHLQFVAFVAETQQEIISANGCRPTFIGTQPANDIALSKVIVDEMICDGEFKPSVEISNFGTNTINSLEINYKINNETTQVYNWTGSLQSLASKTVKLPVISYTPQGNNTFTVNISADDNEDNNSQTSEIVDASQGITWVELKFTTDDNGDEFSWVLKKSDGSVVKSGNDYENNKTYEFNFDLSPDCYRLEIKDENENGGTSLIIKDASDTLYTINGNWGAKKLVRFKTETSAVVPTSNPTSNANGVSLDSYVYINFNQPVRYINDNSIPVMNPDLPVTFKDNNNNDVAFKLFMNPDKTILTIKPQQDFESNMVYTVTFGGGVIENNYDIELENDFTFSFSTGVTGITETKNNIIIYPNPAKNEINITNANNSIIEIYNILGNLVYSSENRKNTCTINISEFSQGSYVIRILYKNRIISKKINIVN